MLDSIIKGYPVGTFIFWSTQERLRSVRDLGNTPLPEPADGVEVNFVLDGQQRLTSLYASLKGLNVTRASGGTDDFSLMYVNLKASEHESIVVTDASTLEAGSYVKLKTLLDGGLGTLSKFDSSYHTALDEYKTRIESYDFPIVRIQDVEIDVATEIFSRINVGGKSLTTFEIMAAKTYDESRQFDLSSKFDLLVAELATVEYETVADVSVLQLIALILDGECNKKAILRLPKSDFIDTWPSAVDSIKMAVDYFRSTYRIPASRMLPYNALLVEFAYFFYKQGQKPDASQSKLLQDYFWRCALGARYSSSLESKLAQDANKIDLILQQKAPDYEWGVDLTPDFILSNGYFRPTRAFVKAILCLYAYQIPKSFNDNSVVNIGNGWLKQANSKNYHHFFPRAFLKKLSIPESYINNVINITIVDDYMNKRLIGAKAPSKYMADFQNNNPSINETMKSHLIGNFKRFGFLKDDYDKFMRERATLVSSELKTRVIERNIDLRGQVVRDDDLEEIDVVGD